MKKEIILGKNGFIFLKGIPDWEDKKFAGGDRPSCFYTAEVQIVCILIYCNNIFPPEDHWKLSKFLGFFT